MARNLIDRKYYPLIWVGLIFASLVANVYSIYLTFAEMEEITRATIVIGVMRAIFVDGAIPAAVCFVLAVVVHSISARRFVSAIPRNDFAYVVMIFTAIARLVCGIVEVFCIIVPRMYVFTSSMLHFVVMTLAYLVMFFFVFARRYNLNPVEKYNCFRIWATIYLVVLGISVVFQNGIYLVVFTNDALLDIINESLKEVLGYIIVKDTLQTIASSIALGLYAVFVVAAIVLGYKMKAEANKMRDPETRGAYFDSHSNNPYTMRDDVGQTYSDFGSDPYKSKLDENPYRSDGDSVNNDNDKNSGDGNVFDEFDI